MPLFPVFFIFLEFHFRKRNSKNFIGFDCVVKIDVVKMFSSSGQQNWVTISLFHSLYTSSPRTDIVYTWYCPRLLNTPPTDVMSTGQGFMACCRKTFDKTGTLQEQSRTHLIHLYSSDGLAQTSLLFCAHRWLLAF